MANFFDVVSRAAITSISVFDKQKFQIGLWGGGPSGDFLNVSTLPPDRGEDPAVRLLRRDVATWNAIYEIDTARIGSRVLHAYDGSRDYSAPVSIVSRGAVPAPTTDKAAVRRRIVELARTFVADSHYLWGTRGNRPGYSDGNPGGGKSSAAKMRAPSFDKASVQRDTVLAVCMAVQPQFSGYNTCAGRCARFRLTPTSAELDAYLAARTKDADDCRYERNWEGLGPQRNLHPRKYHFINNIQNGGREVWGESCYDRPHFDCVGLVNYCIGKFWKNGSFGLDIVKFRDPTMGLAEVKSASDVMDADVIVAKDNSHIAMVYNANGAWKIVQAADTEHGLTDSDAFVAGNWDRFRVAGRYLVD